MLKNILDVFRPLRWYRNLSMVLGALLALKIATQLSDPSSTTLFYRFALSFIAICLVASGNYGINEILDAATDRHHPQKKHRAIPSGRISVPTVFTISILLYVSGLTLITQLHNPMLTFSLSLLAVSGFLYNVKPYRFKDRPFLDFTFEALNNPIRLMVGWYSITPSSIPVPASYILGFWFLGCFLMAAKRFGEIRFIDNKQQAGDYRKSLRFYNEETLLLSMITALVAFSFMLGFLCSKYSVDAILILPFSCVWALWFFHLAYKENTIVKDPERIFEQKGFVLFSVLSLCIFFYLFYSGNQLLAWIN